MSASHCVPESVGLQATLISSWVQVAYRAALHRGLDANALFAKSDIDVQQLYLPDSRIASHKVKKVWDSAAEACGDETFALSASKVVYPGMYHSLSIMLSACGNLREMLEKIIKYRRIIDTLCVNTLEEKGSSLKFTWSPVTNFESQVGAEAWVTCFLELYRYSVGERISPVRVHLQRSVPESPDIAKYRKVFGSGIEFDAEENALYFTREQLEMPLLSKNAVVAAKNEQLTADYMSRVLRGDTVNSVYSLLLNNSVNKNYSIDYVADQLNVTPRTLQRKLKHAGTSYESLLDEIRREKALQYIRVKGLSIQEVGHMLGYADSSNFGRAFRRWTSVSPGAYRESLQ